MKLRKTWIVLALAAGARCGAGRRLPVAASDEVTTTTTAAPPADQPVSGGTLNVYINEPAFIDPVNLQESEGTKVGDALFDSLAKFDPITGEAAAGRGRVLGRPTPTPPCGPSSCARTASSSDGTPVTAADFKYAWERICNPANESEVSYHLAPVKGYDEMQDGTATELAGVKAIDDHTLEVTLNYAFGDFEYVVGHPALAPVPKAAVEKDPDGLRRHADRQRSVQDGRAVGARPVHQGRPQRRLLRRPRPYIDGVDFKILADEDTAWLEFKAGNLDFDESVPSESRAEAIATVRRERRRSDRLPGQAVSWAARDRPSTTSC